MLKVAIAGFGKMGQIRAEEIRKNSQTELVAIFDINTPENISDKVKICSTYDDLLENDLDIMFICAFNDVNAEYTKKALEKGLHVFCEKPPARNTKELQTVLEVEEKTGLVLKYGFNHRLHYSVIEAKKLVDSGEMGKLLWMRGVYGKAGSIDYDKNWRNYRHLSGGGILIDQGIHMLDLMMHFSGETFTHIQSIITNAYWRIESEDNAFVNMQTDTGIIATMHSSATQWKHKFLLELCFEEGYINLDGILSNSRSYAPETLVVGRREFEDITFAMGKPKENITWFEYDDSWKLELDDFLNAIDKKTKVEQGTSSDAHRVLKLIENIYEKSGFYNE